MKGGKCGEKKNGRATLSRKCRRRGKKLFYSREPGKRNDLAIARSRMQKHRDRGRTILEWERRANLPPTECRDKRDDLQTCSRCDTYGAFDFDRKANASTKLSFIGIPADGERAATNFMNYGTNPRIRKNNRLSTPLTVNRTFLIWIPILLEKSQTSNTG